MNIWDELRGYCEAEEMAIGDTFRTTMLGDVCSRRFSVKGTSKFELRATIPVDLQLGAERNGFSILNASLNDNVYILKRVRLGD